MSQGTLSLTNGSKDVTGTGTAFTSDAEAGGWLIFHVGGMPFTVAVESVQSDTSLTLADNFDGATATGIGYSGVPLSALIQIPALTSIQARDAIRRMMMNDANFQQLLTGPDDVTINRPDGSTFSGPSWPKIVELLNGLDIDQITALADQISDDADQVAADKTSAESASTNAQAAKTSAESAATSANADKVDAANSASYSNSRAIAAESSAVRAEQAAESLDTSNFVRKDQPEAGRNALEVYSRDEVDEAIQNGGAGIPLGFRYNHSNRAKLNAGTTPLDGQVVTIAGSFSDLADHAEANEPTTTEADWQANPGKRGCFVINRTAGTMRLPDMNGVQSGSFGPMYQSGDGGTTSAGTMTQNAAPNITGDITANASNFGLIYPGAVSSGALKVGNGTTASLSGNSANAGAKLAIDASLSNSAYGRDGATRVKPDTIHGVWVIQYANAAQNSGEIDALGIDTDLQQFKSMQLAKNAQIEGRIGYALVTTTTNAALNTRTVLSNPFGNNTPVICVPEILHAPSGKWVTAPWIWTATTSTYGIEAAYSEGEGIVLRTPLSGYVAASPATGTTLPAAYNGQNYSTPSPIRIHVWKVTQ